MKPDNELFEQSLRYCYHDGLNQAYKSVGNKLRETKKELDQNKISSESMLFESRINKHSTVLLGLEKNE